VEESVARQANCVALYWGPNSHDSPPQAGALRKAELAFRKCQGEEFAGKILFMSCIILAAKHNGPYGLLDFTVYMN
jgi:hypothetical protein